MGLEVRGLPEEVSWEPGFWGQNFQRTGPEAGRSWRSEQEEGQGLGLSK